MDPVNWAKTGAKAAALAVAEIADPEVVAFPGFDRVLLTHAELQTVLTDSRYRAWHTALGAVKGIYVIADASTGRHYVGKADGAERIFTRWSTYAEMDTVATSRCVNWSVPMQTTHSTSSTASFACSGQACRWPRSTRPRLTSSAHYSPESMA